MCVSLLPMVIVESVFTDFTVAKCVILLHYVQNLRNSINKLTTIYVFLCTDIQRKYLGSLAPCRPCTDIVYTWQVIYGDCFLFPNEIKN